MRILVAFLCLQFCCICVFAQTNLYEVHGIVIDGESREPIPFAKINVEGKGEMGILTDTLGLFKIQNLKPGICRFSIQAMGYHSMLTAEYMISATTPSIEVELESTVKSLQDITVSPSTFRRTAESPVGMQVIGLREIEKSPGSNRDVSRIVRSYPGVSFSPAGYRNDLIVRGGGPSENRFFMDGIEIPNINHFATQGASGGPVSIVNADLVREISFYTGSFPVNRAGGMSSVLDFRLKDGNTNKQTFKATLGASEVALSGSGHIGNSTTYLFSVRQSYLQFLFKALGLPFLPNFIDGQFKIKTRFKNRDELVFLGLMGIDKMKLNTDEKGEEAEYILSYLPRINQETFTLGTTYRHFWGKHIQTYTLSQSYLNNRNLKYKNNDSSQPDNLTLRLRSVEQKTSLRAENRSLYGNWSIKEGIETDYYAYTHQSMQRLFATQTSYLDYRTTLGVWAWGAYASADYTSDNNLLTASFGLRADANDYSQEMKRMWEQLSPRVSLRYLLSQEWSIGFNTGLYHQLPPFTALGYKSEQGRYLNKELDYMRVAQISGGGEWKWKDRLVLSIDVFYKNYARIPLSLTDSIPLACKGDDYGVIGNEALVSSAHGQSYGLEALARWQVPGRLNLTGSFTLYRSEYRNREKDPYIASAWDNRFILNLSGTYDLPYNWSAGLKLSYIGGAPYTPYDEAKSALVEAWDARGRAYYDYSQYNTERLPDFAQLDIRVDKSFYFKKWRMGFYLDLQNVLGSKLKQPDVLMSTGVIENPMAPVAEQRYRLKRIKQESGTLLPTLGITVEF